MIRDRQCPQSPKGVCAATLLLAVLAVVPCGCSVPSQSYRDRLTAGDLLLSPEGKPLNVPAFVLEERLRHADRQTRQQLVESLLDILDAPGGYARLVVAHALVHRPEWWSLSDRGADVIARNVFRIADELPNKTAPNRACVSRNFLIGSSSAAASGLYTLIRPHCAVEVEGRILTVDRYLPEGWCVEEATVQLDGEVIRRGVEYTHRELTEEYVRWESQLAPERLVGEHTLISQLALRSPDGKRVLLARQVVITVAP